MDEVQGHNKMIVMLWKIIIYIWLGLVMYINGNNNNTL